MFITEKMCSKSDTLRHASALPQYRIALFRSSNSGQHRCFVLRTGKPYSRVAREVKLLVVEVCHSRNHSTTFLPCSIRIGATG